MHYQQRDFVANEVLHAGCQAAHLGPKWNTASVVSLRSAGVEGKLRL